MSQTYSKTTNNRSNKRVTFKTLIKPTNLLKNMFDMIIQHAIKVSMYTWTVGLINCYFVLNKNVHFIALQKREYIAGKRLKRANDQ